MSIPTADHAYTATSAATSGAIKRSLDTDDDDTEEESDGDGEDGEDGEDDLRRCVLCGGRGDSAGVAGRLLPLRYNEWVHANCALWSSEVGNITIPAFSLVL